LKSEKFFDFSFLDIYKCPFLENQNILCENLSVVTIIEFYRLMVEKHF